MEMLGISELDLFGYMMGTGAWLKGPFKRIPIDEEVEKVLGIEETLDLANWQTILRGRPTVHDVLYHLMHRKFVLALPRYYGFRRSQYAMTLIPEFDAHSPEQRESLQVRADTFAEVIPFPHIDVVSSFSGGKYRHIPLEMDLSLVEFKPLSFRPGTPITDDWWFLYNEITYIPLIEEELKRIGFRRGDFELFPKPFLPLRMPFGPGSYILDDAGFPVEEPGEAVKCFANRYLEIVNNEPVLTSLFEILQHLKTVPAREMPWHEKRKSKGRTAQDMKPTVEKQTNEIEVDIRRILDDGLWEEDTRVEATLQVIRHFHGLHPDEDAEQLSERVWEWLSAKHNGFSTLMNTSPTRARKWVMTSCKDWIKKAGSTSSHRRTVPFIDRNLTVGDLKRILEIAGPSPIPATTKNMVSHEALLRFLVDFFGYVKGRLVTKRANLSDANHVLEIPIVSLKRMKGTSKKYLKEKDETGRSKKAKNHYEVRVQFLKDKGILTVTRTLYLTGECREYRIDFAFDTGSEPVPDIQAFLRAEMAPAGPGTSNLVCNSFNASPHEGGPIKGNYNHVQQGAAFHPARRQLVADVEKSGQPVEKPEDG